MAKSLIGGFFRAIDRMNKASVREDNRVKREQHKIQIQLEKNDQRIAKKIIAGQKQCASDKKQFEKEFLQIGVSALEKRSKLRELLVKNILQSIYK